MASPIEIQGLSDTELLSLRTSLDIEMQKRGVAFSVGDIGESVAIEFFKKTNGLPKLQASQRGTKNVDANSRNGERYSIKTICKGKKTGTIYPEPGNPDKQLFEYLLIVKLSKNWTLEAIHQFSWDAFVDVRSWDKRMSAWYVGISSRTMTAAKPIFLQKPRDV